MLKDIKEESREYAKSKKVSLNKRRLGGKILKIERRNLLIKL